MTKIGWREVLAFVMALASFGLSEGRALATIAASIPVDGGLIAIQPPDTSGVIAYKGVPYAAPPVGPMRWKPPGPVQPWADVRSAAEFGADCPQAPSPSSPASRPRSEDCLFLNIWTGATAGARRPVFVWIHGGGSRFGSGSQPQFDGEALAKKGIVVVTINYRLGALGFLSSHALSAESPHHTSGDYGFMDDIAALRWVARNIASFGGDPLRVTVGGESSGSVSASVLMASPLAKGLFQQAIGESGSSFRVAQFGSMGATGLAIEETKGDRLSVAIGATGLATLRAAPADVVLAAAARMGATFNLPVVDGYVLPDAPWRLFKSHHFNDVPLLVGWNAQEGSLQLGHLAPLPDLLKSYYGAAAPKVADFYRSTGRDDSAFLIQAAGDNGIAYPTWKWALAQTLFGKRPVYVYEFDHAPPSPAGAFGPTVNTKLAGAYHGAEIVYVFDTLASEPQWAVSDVDRHIAGAMSTYWANFITKGDPNGAGLAVWSPYALASGPSRMRISDRSHQEPDPDFERFTAIRAAHDRIDPPDPAPPGP